MAGIPGRLGEGIDGRVGERLRVQVPRTDVLGVQQVPCLPDEIEVGSAGRLLDDLAARQRTDALEAGARGEDGDDQDTRPDDHGRPAQPAPDRAARWRGTRLRTEWRSRIGGPAVRWRQGGGQVRHVDGWIARVGGHRSSPSEAARWAWEAAYVA